MKTTTSSSKRAVRWRLWLALLVLASGIGFVIITRLNSDAPLPATTRIARGNLESAVLATGVLKPQSLVAIGAQATGRILSLKVRPGQKVRKGDVIALIDATSQQNELQKAQATLRQNAATRAQNTAQLELARSELARNQLMVANKAIARSEYDKAISALKVQEAQLSHSEAVIAAAQVEVKIAETNLAYTRITAPIDGTVLATLVQEGQTVNAAQSAPTIAILGALDTMTVEADISEADITRVQPGLAVYFTVSGDSAKRYQAKLATINPAPDTIVNDKSFAASSVAAAPATSAVAIYYKGIFQVPNKDGFLKTYMTAEIHIVLDEARDVLIAPVSALRRAEDNKAIVRVLGPDGRTSDRLVVTGISDKINTEIRSGLKAGETILTDNQLPDPDAVSSDAATEL
ncbi:macrolide export protein MacA [Brucella sp. NBRC 12953]|uniref:efflux RND transporter periplasmic adaptor subunit n=1 Tax=Brucella sp. NBRC 12953 TaxID=3075481 RepID=UPI000DE243F4